MNVPNEDPSAAVLHSSSSSTAASSPCQPLQLMQVVDPGEPSSSSSSFLNLSLTGGGDGGPSVELRFDLEVQIVGDEVILVKPSDSATDDKASAAVVETSEPPIPIPEGDITTTEDGEGEDGSYYFISEDGERIPLNIVDGHLLFPPPPSFSISPNYLDVNPLLFTTNTAFYVKVGPESPLHSLSGVDVITANAPEGFQRFSRHPADDIEFPEVYHAQQVSYRVKEDAVSEESLCREVPKGTLLIVHPPVKAGGKSSSYLFAARENGEDCLLSVDVSASSTSNPSQSNIAVSTKLLGSMKNMFHEPNQHHSPQTPTIIIPNHSNSNTPNNNSFSLYRLHGNLLNFPQIQLLSSPNNNVDMERRQSIQGMNVNDPQSEIVVDPLRLLFQVNGNRILARLHQSATGTPTSSPQRVLHGEGALPSSSPYAGGNMPDNVFFSSPSVVPVWSSPNSIGQQQLIQVPVVGNSNVTQFLPPPSSSESAQSLSMTSPPSPSLALSLTTGGGGISSSLQCTPAAGGTNLFPTPLKNGLFVVQPQLGIGASTPTNGLTNIFVTPAGHFSVNASTINNSPYVIQQQQTSCASTPSPSLQQQFQTPQTTSIHNQAQARPNRIKQPKMVIEKVQVQRGGLPPYTIPISTTKPTVVSPSINPSRTQPPSPLGSPPTGMRVGLRPVSNEPFNRLRFIDGLQALCPHCGISTNDLHFCYFCKSRIPDEPKMVGNATAVANATAAQGPSAPAPAPAESPSSGTGANKLKRPKPVSPKKGSSKKDPEEVVLVSSDDEDDNRPPSKISKPDPSLSPSKTNSSSGTGPPPTPKKELVVNLSSSFYSSIPNPVKKKDDFDAPALLAEIEGATLSVKFNCRSVRVGDYKCVSPTTTPYSMTLSDKGVLFTIPHSRRPSTIVKCPIPFDCILQVEGHFKKSMPCIFLSTGIKYARFLRNQIGLGDKPDNVGFFYDPQDGDKYQKRLTFIIEGNPTEQDIGTLSKIFGRCMSQIDHAKANEILLQITRTDTTTSVNNTPRKASEPKQAAQPPPQSHHPSQMDISEDNRSLINYNGVSIGVADIGCLADEQFLNDSILDFWLKYVDQQMLTPVDRERTYMFSTFFYKRLTTKPKKGNDVNSKLSAAERRHERVKRWTKNVDIFEKDFLIVPINENLHWFVAVICYPGMIGAHDMETDEPVVIKKRPRLVLKSKPIASVQVSSQNGCEATSNATSSSEQPGPSRVSTSTDAESLEPEESDEKEANVKIKQPCIIIFDSLIGENRNRIFSTLREYLKVEYKTRKLQDREFNRGTMPGELAEVPQQPNHYDCGPYSLFYVECFFKKPIRSFDFPLPSYSEEWEDEEVLNGKREEIYDAIRDLLTKLKPESLSFFPPLTFVKAEPENVNVNMHEEQDNNGPANINHIHHHNNNTDSSKNEIGDNENESANPIPSILHQSKPSCPEDNEHDHDYAVRNENGNEENQSQEGQQQQQQQSPNIVNGPYQPPDMV